MIKLNKIFFKRAATLVAGGLAGFTVMVAVPANASDRPSFCNVVHDHRSHNTSYYKYYDADKYYRAGPYRSNASFSITFGNRGYDRGHNNHNRSHKRRSYDDRGYDNRGSNNHRSDRRRHNNRGYTRTGYYDNSHAQKHTRKYGHSKLLRRDVYKTKYHARIIVKEEIVYGRRRNLLTCTVSARGPESEYISYRQLEKVAYRKCSRRAKVKINK